MWRWVICGAALLLGGCSGILPQKFKFRLTVEVETTEGIRRGSGVYQVWANRTISLLPDEAKRDWGVQGDAVAVDISRGRTIFSLLKTSNPMREDLAQMAMAALDPTFHNDIVESAGRLSQRSGVRTQAEIARGDFPLLVAFRDTADPTSIAKVDPDDLALHFGAGVRLKRIWVELVGDPVTSGIENRLRWLGDTGLSLDSKSRPTSDPTFAQTIRHSAFWQGPR